VPSVLAKDLGLVLNQQAVSDAIEMPATADDISTETEHVNELVTEDTLAESETIHQIDAILPSEMPDVQPEMVDAGSEIAVSLANLVAADAQETEPVMEDESEASYSKDETIKTLTMAFLDLVETYSDDVTVDTCAAEYDAKGQLPVENTEEAHESPAAAVSEADPAMMTSQTVIMDEPAAVEDIVSVEENRASCIQPTVQDEKSEN